MLNTIWSWICSLFGKQKIGILTKLIFTTSTSVFVKDLLDKENQRKAYEFVVELNKRTDLSNLQKAEVFNKKMLEWSIKEGKKITTSIINALRELAVNAVKSELEIKNNK